MKNKVSFKERKELHNQKISLWWSKNSPKKLCYRIKTHDFNPEIAVISLINKHFWKSKIGPISSIVLPVMFMLMYKIMSIGVSNGIFALSLPTYLTLSVLPLTLITLPQVICEFKTSIILRKISVSTITKFRFTFILLAYYFIALICSTLGVITLYAAFLANAAPEYFAEYNWGQLIYALLNLYMASLFSGLILGVLLKRAGLVQIIGICILLLSMMLAGQLMPLSVLGQSQVAKIVSLFSPLSYPMSLVNNVLCLPDAEFVNNVKAGIPAEVPNELKEIMQLQLTEFNKLNAMMPEASNLFNTNPFFLIDIFTTPLSGSHADISVLTGVKQNIIYEGWHKVLNLVMPWVISITFGAISMKIFKWTSR